MSFIDRSDKLRFAFWDAPEFLGEQWGVGVHDIDGNGFLDFYANHHGQPTGEIILNFATASAQSVFFEIPGDLHGVTFFDIDQDGDADMLIAQGGRSGAASNPNDASLWNKVQLNVGGVFGTANRVGDFGVEYGLGRGRLLTPINLDGDLSIYAGVLNDRPDESFQGQMFGRNASGSYDPIAPFGDEISGEVAIGVHLGSDRFADVVNLDWKARELRVFENRGAGFGEVVKLSAGGSQVSDFAVGDFDGDLTSEILFGRAGRRDALFRQDAAGNWLDVSAESTAPFAKTSRLLVAGDFDNDGDLDYAAVKEQAGVEVQTYLNRGDGVFEPGSRFIDPSIPGRGDKMISGDFNRDGALDLLITTSAAVAGGGSQPGTYVLLEGEVTGNNWLSIALKGSVSETGGLGARVFVTTPGGKAQVLEQDSGAHFTSQNSTDLHFGLGDHAVADVRVVWPDGFEQHFKALAANRHLVLTERRDAPFAFFLKGGAEDEELRGSNSADLIRARGGDDFVSGRRGNDVLFGGAGADRLFGGADEDTLFGRGGADRITGGAGADNFILASVSDSRPGDGRDVIQDFVAGVDLLDLSRIDANAVFSGAQAFDFVGAAAFGQVAGQLRYSGGIVMGDVDGDGAADFEIRIENRPNLGMSDMLL